MFHQGSPQTHHQVPIQVPTQVPIQVPTQVPTQVQQHEKPYKPDSHDRNVSLSILVNPEPSVIPEPPSGYDKVTKNDEYPYIERIQRKGANFWEKTGKKCYWCGSTESGTVYPDNSPYCGQWTCMSCND